MKINFDLKFYKIVTLILALLLVFSLLNMFFLFKEMKTQRPFSPVNKIEIPRVSQDIITLSQNKKSHKISACSELVESGTSTTYVVYDDTEKDGYKIFLDCSVSRYPDRKTESFGVVNIKNNIKTYFDERDSYILGGPEILGTKNDLLFYKYCYEGCSQPRAISLSENINMDLESFVYDLESIFIRNKVYSTDLIVINNRVVIVEQNKIWELNTNNFSLKILKEISEDKIFGRYSQAGYGFYADYVKKENGIEYKIYDKKSAQGINSSTIKPIETGFLEIK